MKNVIIMLMLGLSLQARAQNVVTENVVCDIRRTLLGETTDAGVVTEKVEAQVSISGPHNGESGTVEIKSKLLSSYKITMGVLTSGLTDELSLMTESSIGPAALSSVDLLQIPRVENKFTSNYGEYQFVISCGLKNR